MTRARKWLLGTGIGALLLAGALAAALAFIPSDEELATRASEKLASALGAKVSIGALHWHLLPAYVTVNKLVIAQKQPIILEQLTLYPNLAALWQRRIRFERVELQGAVVPQLSLRGLGKNSAGDEAKGGFSLAELPLERFVFRDLSWISRRGIPVIYEGEIDFDAAWRPRAAALRRPGVKPATDLAIAREGQDDRWSVRINLGGGTLNGNLQLQTKADGRLHLAGQLQPRNIEVSQALAAFNRRPGLAGKASGSSTLFADGATAFELAQSLRTTTPFTMGRSTLLRFDLDRAIKTVGKDHAGQTALESITGRLDTQNTPDGMVTRFNDIAARSGALSASGKASLFNQQIDAEFAVDLVDGLVGVPLKLSGPVSKVRVSMPGGAVAGAVVGTAVLPGIGTAIGARLGAAVGKLFGSGADKSASPVAGGTPAAEAGGPQRPSSQPAR